MLRCTSMPQLRFGRQRRFDFERISRLRESCPRWRPAPAIPCGLEATAKGQFMHLSDYFDCLFVHRLKWLTAPPAPPSGLRISPSCLGCTSTATKGGRSRNKMTESGEQTLHFGILRQRGGIHGNAAPARGQTRHDMIAGIYSVISEYYVIHLVILGQKLTRDSEFPFDSAPQELFLSAAIRKLACGQCSGLD